MSDRERGSPARFDRVGGTVHGSGAGAGGGNPGEDYDDDEASGSGHPLPASDEARHDEIPEDVERRKGHGDDSEALVQPAGEAVNPDGEPYPGGD
jgi:hypothetical protein